MRTREKGYQHYGLTDARANSIVKYCKSKMLSREKVLSVAKEAVGSKNDYLVDYLTESIVDGISYDKLEGKYWLPLGRGDFYGYRRLVIASLDVVVPKE